MESRKIFITAFDKMRLDDLVAVAREFDAQDREHLADLEAELKRAKVVDSKEEMTSTLVFPKGADVDSGAISILAPVGTALLGY